MFINIVKTITILSANYYLSLITSRAYKFVGISFYSMDAMVIRSYVSESVLNPLIAFELEITCAKSENVILQVSGRLMMNHNVVLAPVIETFIGRNLNDFEGQLVATDSSEDSNLFIESKYITELSAIVDEKILKYIEDDGQNPPTSSSSS